MQQNNDMVTSSSIRSGMEDRRLVLGKWGERLRFGGRVLWWLRTNSPVRSHGSCSVRRARVPDHGGGGRAHDASTHCGGRAVMRMTRLRRELACGELATGWGRRRAHRARSRADMRLRATMRAAGAATFDLPLSPRDSNPRWSAQQRFADGPHQIFF
jgi:hypothetical protein